MTRQLDDSVRTVVEKVLLRLEHTQNPSTATPITAPPVSQAWEITIQPQAPAVAYVDHQLRQAGLQRNPNDAR